MTLPGFTFGTYPDGFQYARVDFGSNFDEVSDARRTWFRPTLNSFEDLWLLRSAKEAWDSYVSSAELDIKSILQIPCMPQMQHDRRFNIGESFELKLVADFINNCKFDKVQIFHPHSDVTPALINNSEVFDCFDLFEESINQVSLMEGQPPVILSTDAGSFKWVYKLVEKWEKKHNSSLTVVCGAKSRDPISHKLTQSVDKLDFGGRSILIVDDLCVYGGTFVGLANCLKLKNCGTLFLMVAHMTVKAPSLLLESSFKRIFTTNSKFGRYDAANIVVFKTPFKS